VIHEQNAFAGLTNRKLAGMASTVLTGFRSCEGLSNESIWVGNPVRQSIIDMSTGSSSKENVNSDKDEQKPINVLILGGSQGASSLNEQLPKALSKCVDGLRVRVLHQTGQGRSDVVNASYKSKSGFESVLVEEFVEQMDVAYRWAHLVICRAGAMTISELMAMGKPSVLVPYPHAAGDHQTKNARVMVKTGAATMVADDALSSNEFITQITTLLQSESKLKQANV